MHKTKFLRYVTEKILFNFLKDSKVKPLHLLFARILFAIITGVVLLFGNYLYAIIFLTIYQFIFLFDYVDGKLARYRKEFSLKWRKIDRALHYLTSALFLLAITIPYYLKSNEILIFLIGLCGFLSIIATFLVDTLNLRDMDFDKMKIVHSKKGLFRHFYSFLAIDGSFTFFFFLVIFNQIKIAIIFLSVLNLLILIKKINMFIKWKKKK